MYKLLRYAALSFVLLCCAMTVRAQGDQTSIRVNISTGTTGAWLHLPDDYNTTATNYPLLIFLHGLGEAGTNLNLVLAHGVPKMISKGAKMQYTVNGKLFKFIVVSPQIPSGWSNETDIQNLINDVKSRYRIDADRIYLTGLSAGGAGTWNYAASGAKYANNLAAIVPVSASAIDDSKIAGLCTLAGSNVPVWALGGNVGADLTFLTFLQTYTADVNACNPKTKAITTVYQGTGHDDGTWDRAYDTAHKYQTPNIYEWMLQYSRSTTTSTAANARAQAAQTSLSITLPVNTVTLDGTPSTGTISTYAWTQVSGPVTAAIVSKAAAKTVVNNLTTAGTYVFQLKVTGADGLSNTVNVTVVVNKVVASNAKAIVTTATQSITLPVKTATLDGSPSTGTISTYGWTQVSGPVTATIVSAAAAKTVVNNLSTAGTYVFQLKVTGADGLNTTVNETVVVNKAAANAKAIVASASQDITLPVTTASLDGSASSGDIAQYEWSQVSGPATAVIAASGSATTTVSNLVSAGTYVFQLQVTGTDGLTSVAQSSVVVIAAITATPSSSASEAVGCSSCKFLIKPDSKGAAYIDGSSMNVQPGDTVCVQAGKYTAIMFLNFTGTAAKPIVFINCGGQVVIGNNGNYGFGFTNSKYFIVTGSGSNDKYGFLVDGGGPDLPTGMAIGKGCSDYEAAWIEIERCGVGMFAKINPDCDPINQAPNFEIRNVKLHDLYVHDTQVEGLYIGNSSPNGTSMTCNGSTITALPPRIYNLKIYNVTTKNTGWDGIQVSTAPEGVEVYDNSVTDYGMAKEYGQNSGIIMGGSSTGLVHNNKVINGSGPGIQVFGIGLIQVYNNVVTGAGKYDPSPNLDDGIFIDTRPNLFPDEPLRIYAFNNTVVNSQRNGIRFLDTYNLTGKGNLFYNNLIVDVDTSGNYGSRDYLNVAGGLDYKSANNLYIGDLTSPKFVNAAGNDFHLQTGSPAIDAGMSLTSLGVTKDMDYNSRPLGKAFDIGAYEFAGSTPVDKAPIAKAGNDITITLPENSIKLDGTASTDPDGTIVTYAWKNISGPAGATIEQPSASTTTVSNLQEGTYVYVLEVTDNGGATDSDTISVFVKALNQLPVANAGPAQTITLPVSSVTLDGSASADPDGKIVSYKWTRISGGNAVIASATSVSTKVTSLVAGTYIFQLQVTDDKGGSSTSNVTVTVLPEPPANKAPIANAGADISINLPNNSANLDGSNSYDPDGTIASYKWVLVSAPSNVTVTFGQSGNASTTVNGLTVAGAYVFALTVKDNKGVSATDQVTVTVAPAPAANIPPVASAGSNASITLPLDYTVLNGSASYDPDGTIASYLWVQVSGGNAVLADPTAATTKITGLSQGPHVFSLTVTDNKGSVSTAQVTITVFPQPVVNKAPVANAGTDASINLPNNTYNLDGGNSYDPDGTIASYVWTQVSGATATIAEPSSVRTAITGLSVAGTYVFKLTVTDNSGAVASDNVTITVDPAPVTNRLPVADAGSDFTITLPTNTATLDGSNSYDPDGSIVSYKWTKTSGNGGTIAQPSTATTAISGLLQGTYVFSLTVTDNAGATNTAKITITVLPAVVANKAPVANAGNDISIALPNSSITLNGNASYDPDGSIVSYQWQKVSGGQATIASANTASTAITGLYAGTYIFSLTVTDDKGATATDKITVTVTPASTVNTPPVANAGANITITLPVNSATLDGSASYDPDGTISGYSWTQQSGGAATIANPQAATTQITELAVGLHTFILTVTDNSGATAQSKVTINVLSEPTDNQPPVANAGQDQVVNASYGAFTLDGNASYDPDGTIVSYQWNMVSGPAAASLLSPSQSTTTAVATTPGVYVFSLTVTDNNGETSMATVQIIVQNDDGTVPDDLDIKIFPNPTSNELHVSTSKTVPGNISMLVYSSNGHLVKNIHLGVGASLQTTINVTDLPSGLYLLKITDGKNYNFIHKFLKIQ